ncbi:hypothetical protein [Actinomadura sp. B10D3]|uniref:hypothetical protein n=1 Tax=Actinomadura sp. B10D3 TaxID=3153557 RepID=UPI00325D18F0
MGAQRHRRPEPRLEQDCGLTALILDQITANPAKAPLGTFTAELARQYGIGPEAPSWADLTSSAWPGIMT